MFNFAPQLRDALTCATAVAGRAQAWILGLQKTLKRLTMIVSNDTIIN